MHCEAVTQLSKEVLAQLTTSALWPALRIAGLRREDSPAGSGFLGMRGLEANSAADFTRCLIDPLIGSGSLLRSDRDRA